MPSKRLARTGEAVAEAVVFGVVVVAGRAATGEGFSRDIGRGVTLFSLRLEGREPGWLVLLMWFSMYRFVGWYGSVLPCGDSFRELDRIGLSFLAT